MPEYRGIRKQTEYNEDLIKTSDFFIAIFRGNCGTFTREEVQLWTDGLHRMPVVFDISDPTIDKTAVNTYLNSKGLTPVVVSDDADIYAQVTAVVASFIDNQPKPTSIPETIETKELYKGCCQRNGRAGNPDGSP